MKRLLVCSFAAGVLCGACQQPSPRLNAPPHGQTDNPSPMQDTYAQMEDNALLADMSVTDVHFLPHRAALNSLGEQRLCRLASLLEMYGGNVRFYSREQDAVLMQDRVKTVKEFLAAEGIETTEDTVVRDLPGGRGLDAPQAILIRATEGAYVPKKSSAGSGDTKTQTSTGKKSN